MKPLLSWYNTLTSFQEVFSFQLHFSKDGKPVYRGARFKRKGDELFLEGNCIESRQLDEIKEAARTLPLVLILTGKGVLLKKSNSEKSGLALVKDTFPQIQVEDFYHQVNAINEGNLVSILRKNQLDFLWEIWPELQLHSICWHLGVGTLSMLFQNDTELSSYQLLYQNGHLDTINPTSEESQQELEFSGEKIAQNQAVLQMAAATCLFGIHPLSSSQNEQNNGNARNMLERLLIKRGAVLAILLTLLLVLGNFFTFNHFSEALNQASIQKMSVEKEMRQLERQQQQFKEQQELFNKLNFKEETHHSELADQIASRAGKHIQFTSINIFPELDSRSAKKSLAFDRNKLVITGKSKNSEAFKSFTQSLAELDLLSEVQMTQFSRNPKVSAYDFKLIATLNEE